MLDQLVEQRFLVLEVPVEEALGHAGGLGRCRATRVVGVAALGEQLGGRSRSCCLRSRPWAVSRRSASSLTAQQRAPAPLTRGSMTAPGAGTVGAMAGGDPRRAHRRRASATRSGRTRRCSSRCRSASTATPASATARRSSARSSTTDRRHHHPRAVLGLRQVPRPPARSTASTRSPTGRRRATRRVVGRAGPPPTTRTADARVATLHRRRARGMTGPTPCPAPSRGRPTGGPAGRAVPPRLHRQPERRCGGSPRRSPPPASPSSCRGCPATARRSRT